MAKVILSTKVEGQNFGRVGVIVHASNGKLITDTGDKFPMRPLDNHKAAIDDARDLALQLGHIVVDECNTLSQLHMCRRGV